MEICWDAVKRETWSKAAWCCGELLVVVGVDP